MQFSVLLGSTEYEQLLEGLASGAVDRVVVIEFRLALNTFDNSPSLQTPVPNFLLIIELRSWGTLLFFHLGLIPIVSLIELLT